MSDDAETWFRRGYALHRRPWAWGEAEAAYRRSIAAGRPEAWLNLGLLLQLRPGRDEDAKAAFRAAMACENDAVAAWAARRLGVMLDVLDGDLATAKECLTLAQARGRGRTRETATMNMALLLAEEGDREGATAAFHAFISSRYRRAGLEAGTEDVQPFAQRLAALTSRRSFRRWRVVLYAARRAWWPIGVCWPRRRSRA